MENWFIIHFLSHLPGLLSVCTPLQHNKIFGDGGGVVLLRAWRETFGFMGDRGRLYKSLIANRLGHRVLEARRGALLFLSAKLFQMIPNRLYQAELAKEYFIIYAIIFLLIFVLGCQQISNELSQNVNCKA